MNTIIRESHNRITISTDNKKNLLLQIFFFKFSNVEIFSSKKQDAFECDFCVLWAVVKLDYLTIVYKKK